MHKSLRRFVDLSEQVQGLLNEINCKSESGISRAAALDFRKQLAQVLDQLDGHCEKEMRDELRRHVETAKSFDELVPIFQAHYSSMAGEWVELGRYLRSCELDVEHDTHAEAAGGAE